jgi:hypothetical protein
MIMTIMARAQPQSALYALVFLASASAERESSSIDEESQMDEPSMLQP